jgi:hypothetical protein
MDSTGYLNWDRYAVASGRQRHPVAARSAGEVDGTRQRWVLEYSPSELWWSLWAAGGLLLAGLTAWWMVRRD